MSSKPVCGAAFTSAGVAVAALVPCAWAKPGDNASAPTPARAVIRKDIDEFIMPIPNLYYLDLIVLSKAFLPSEGRSEESRVWKECDSTCRYQGSAVH